MSATGASSSACKFLDDSCKIFASRSALARISLTLMRLMNAPAKFVREFVQRQQSQSKCKEAA